MRHPLRLLVLATALAAGATTAAAMLGGTVVDDAAPTGMVFLTFPGYSCSGTLLTPRWVLTARHCVVPQVDDFGAHGILDAEAPAAVVSAGTRAALWDPGHQFFIMAGWGEDSTEVPAVRVPALWAFSVTGQPSALFGDARGDGSAVVQLDGVRSAELTALVRAPSGELFAAGYAEVAGTPRVLVLGFDGAGHLRRAPYPATGATIGFAPAPLGRARGLAIEPTSGDLIVVGSMIDRGVERWTAARFSSSGAVRTAYGYLDASPQRGALVDVAIVGGRVIAVGTRDGRPTLAVLGDAALGPTQVLAGSITDARALAADPAGFVVVAGQDAGGARVIALRYAAATLGLDGSFGAGGIAIRTTEDASWKPDVMDVAVDEARRVVIGLEILHGHKVPTAARFTADGRPDPDFGQRGLVTWFDAYPREGASVALAPGRVLVATSLAGPSATLFDAGFDPLASDTGVRLGDRSGTVRRIVVNPDASIDAALIELEAPLTAAADVRVTGFADPDDVAVGTRVVCHGYGFDGPDDTGHVGILHRSEFLFDGVRDPRHYRVAPDCPDGSTCTALLQHGDSGGACFVVDSPTAWRLLGVESGGDVLDPGELTWDANHAHDLQVRADVIADWVTTTLATSP